MRIVDSNVKLNIQHSASRQQEQQTQAVAVRPDLADLSLPQAQLEFSAQDSVALSSQSQRLAQTVGGENVEAEFVREAGSERVVNTVAEGFEAWQALSLQGVTSMGNMQTIAGNTLVLQVETAVTQQVRQCSVFTAQGTATDECGNEIRFQLGLQLHSQQELNAQSEFTLVMRQRTDPLVINFDAASAQLTDVTFDFDLNADGRRETLAQLGFGSGYLVFDRNKNGVADDGSELFGAASGDGFADLKQYDADGNLWLDESDPQFADLSVWVSDQDGSSALFSLHEMGIGAIYLGAGSDDFELTSSLGVPMGSIRAHSVVLMENGDVRTAQQLDLVELTPVAAVAQATPAQATPMPAAEIRFVGAVEMGTDRTRANMERLRLQRQDYRRRLQEDRDEKPKSMLEQLLQKMDELRARYREMLVQRERVGRLYQGR